MNLLRIEIDLLGTFLDIVTRRWKELKDSPDVGFYRDSSQYTCLSLPDLYIDHNIPDGTLEILRPGEGDWKDFRVWNEKESREIILNEMGVSYSYLRQFPNGIFLMGNSGAVPYHYIKYHHRLDLETLEELGKGIGGDFDYVRFGDTSSFRTTRLLSSYSYTHHRSHEPPQHHE